MIWGLDSEFPPDEATATTYAAQGWAFWGGYVGGHAAHVWTKADFAAIADAAMKSVAFWVGPLSGDPGYDQGVSDGNACLVALQDRGLSGWVWDDAEGGIVRREWSRGFVDALHAGSCSVGVYGTRATLEGMGDLYDSWYLAWYASPNQVIGAQQIIDFDHWQYSDGPNEDYSVARDDAPFTVYNG